MNKQEAIKEIDGYAVISTFVPKSTEVIKIEKAKEIISQIHEPQTVVVPKEVAEWIEGCKRSGWHLQKVLSRLDDDEKVGDWAYDRNDDLIPEKVDMIARAWLDGYEIEQEKLYTVEVVGTGQYLVERYKKQGYVFIDTEDPLLFTKAELEQAGFGWVFDCNGVKVEEVDDDTR